MIVTAVGNYPKTPDRPRPARLRTAYARLERADIAPEDFAAIEDEVTADVLAEQQAAGVELLTDGQIRWLDEQTYLAGRLDGIALNGLTRFFDTNTYFREPIVEGAIVWREPLTVRDYELASATATRPVKPVLTGPCSLARLSRDEHYGSLEDLAFAYADALNAEARALQALEPPLIQFNEPVLTAHPEDLPLAEKVWPRLLDGLSLETAVYFYFGPPGAAVAAAVRSGFTTVGVDATRPGVLDALRAGPLSEKLAVGVIDSRTTRLEAVDEIAATVSQALTLRDADRLYVNPNQGLEFLPREQARLKLARLVEGVEAVRGGAK